MYLESNELPDEFEFELSLYIYIRGGQTAWASLTEGSLSGVPDSKGNFYLFVRKVPVRVTLPPEFDWRKSAASALGQHLTDIRAAFAKHVTDLNGLLNSILAIEQAPAKPISPNPLQDNDIPF